MFCFSASLQRLHDRSSVVFLVSAVEMKRWWVWPLWLQTQPFFWYIESLELHLRVTLRKLGQKRVGRTFSEKFSEKSMWEIKHVSSMFGTWSQIWECNGQRSFSLNLSENTVLSQEQCFHVFLKCLFAVTSLQSSGVTQQIRKWRWFTVLPGTKLHSARVALAEGCAKCEKGTHFNYSGKTELFVSFAASHRFITMLRCGGKIFKQ